jgi:hypothetical protein
MFTTTCRVYAQPPPPHEHPFQRGLRDLLANAGITGEGASQPDQRGRVRAHERLERLVVSWAHSHHPCGWPASETEQRRKRLLETHGRP